MITPAVIDSPEPSPPLSRSTEATDVLCECLEDFDPAALLALLGARVPSSKYLESVDLSLCNFLPKNDLPPEDCLDLLSPGGVVDGIFQLTTLPPACGGTEDFQPQKAPAISVTLGVLLWERESWWRLPVVFLCRIGCHGFLNNLKQSPQRSNRVAAVDVCVHMIVRVVKKNECDAKLLDSLPKTSSEEQCIWCQPGPKPVAVGVLFDFKGCISRLLSAPCAIESILSAPVSTDHYSKTRLLVGTTWDEAYHIFSLVKCFISTSEPFYSVTMNSLLVSMR